MTTTALVPGSIGAMAQQGNKSIAEIFSSLTEVIALVDVSGSMDSHDSRDGRSRYEVACEELAKLQAKLPGRIAVVAFSSDFVFVPSGQPPFLCSGTDLAKALKFVNVADGTVRFIVISDGQPNDPQQALKIARTFKSRIDVVYTGPEGDRSGARFLEELATCAGGKYAVAAQAQQLCEKVQLMLKPGN